MSTHVDGRPWVDALAVTLPRPAQLLGRLLTELESDDRFRSLEIQCSIARGAGDELSDLDVGIGIADARWDEAVADLPGILGGLAPLLDLLETTLSGQPYFFVQYADGMQVDAVARPSSRIKGRVPAAVVLFDLDGVFSTAYEPPIMRADATSVRDWRYLAWIALANVAKYVQRGSLWEARRAVEEARGHLLQLHAASHAVAYPEYGLTSILDAPEAPLPEGLGLTVAGIERDEILAAALACADLLEPHDPPPMAAWVRGRLEVVSAL